MLPIRIAEVVPLGMDLNKFIDNFLKKTLWVWLPFYALFDLIHEVGERAGKK